MHHLLVDLHCTFLPIRRKLYCVINVLRFFIIFTLYYFYTASITLIQSPKRWACTHFVSERPGHRRFCTIASVIQELEGYLLCKSGDKCDQRQFQKSQELAILLRAKRFVPRTAMAKVPPLY